VAEEEKIYIPITAKFIGATMVAMVVAFGSYPLANWFNPDLRNDPFTGARGDGLEDRIETIEVELSDCQRNSYMHREKQAETFATIKAKTLSNEYLIKQCMKITRQ